MMSEKPPHKILEGLHAIIAQELLQKPLRRAPAIADPALWRAIRCQQKDTGPRVDAAYTAAVAQTVELK